MERSVDARIYFICLVMMPFLPANNMKPMISRSLLGSVPARASHHVLAPYLGPVESQTALSGDNGLQDCQKDDSMHL